ncbi:C40 family peptidase [Chitinophaga rhizophila]|uniref:C40 family peptidase n=1 Tax=Chitinophaga rhizophila TaxID=2866212 RepID=A0ABS7GLI9_9BACT|nr:C40 family peptidase [Chitinophaga rhizophila]MBW8687659.1 C40 family peptidase [Chitinophaga rhizophila]
MPYAITVVPIMPLRAEQSHKSEIISQALWGECSEIISTGADGWVRVKCQYDGYEGWATVNHLETIDEALFNAPYTHYTAGWINQVHLNGKPMQVPFGCLLKHGSTAVTNWGRVTVQLEETPAEIGSSANISVPALLKAAFLYLNTAYLWGGKSVFGVDCSGFTQTIFKTLGIHLLRDAYQQATQGSVVDFLQEARTGDLAFFDNAEGRITHVGILLNDHEIIHASGKVRVDPIDNQGITNIDTGVRTHKLRIIKRYF